LGQWAARGASGKKGEGKEFEWREDLFECPGIGEEGKKERRRTKQEGKLIKEVRRDA